MVVFTRKEEGKVYNGVINTSLLLRKTKQTQLVRALAACHAWWLESSTCDLHGGKRNPAPTLSSDLHLHATHTLTSHTIHTQQSKKSKLNILIKVKSCVLLWKIHHFFTDTKCLSSSQLSGLGLGWGQRNSHISIKFEKLPENQKSR